MGARRLAAELLRGTCESKRVIDVTEQLQSMAHAQLNLIRKGFDESFLIRVWLVLGKFIVVLSYLASARQIH
jgi:hypothetical protein